MEPHAKNRKQRLENFIWSCNPIVILLSLGAILALFLFYLTSQPLHGASDTGINSVALFRASLSVYVDMGL